MRRATGLHTKKMYLERHDDPPEVRLVLLRVVDVLRIQYVVHGHQVALFG